MFELEGEGMGIYILGGEGREELNKSWDAVLALEGAESQCFEGGSPGRRRFMSICGVNRLSEMYSGDIFWSGLECQVMRVKDLTRVRLLRGPVRARTAHGLGRMGDHVRLHSLCRVVFERHI